MVKQRTITDDARQGRICVCSICENTWLTMDPPAHRNGEGVTCPCCIYLEMTRRHANAMNITMREAVRRYLLGQMKRMKTSFNQLWKAKSL